jgi:DNA-binding GntR family transcriptional regulator
MATGRLPARLAQMASRGRRGGTDRRAGRSREILDRTSFVPLYFQLAEMLKERIESARWPPGARFLSESEIEAEFDVSRTVIRPALALLESDGQLVRIKGRGNFVATPKQGIAIQGMSRLLSSPDPTGLSVDILEARTITPESAVAQMLRLDSRDAKVAHLTARVRRDDAPLFICNSFAALSRLPWILDAARARSRAAEARAGRPVLPGELPGVPVVAHALRSSAARGIRAARIQDGPQSRT